MVLSESYRIRQLQSGDWACEIVRVKQFLWFEPYTTVVGFSGMNEWPIGSREYARYCVDNKFGATQSLHILENKNGV